MSILKRFSLKGKVVLLTGGAGLYGRQLTVALAEAGAHVVIAARNRARLCEIARAQAKRGYSVSCEILDQGKERSVLALRRKVLKQFGRVDGLVNNAVARPMKSLDAPATAWEESLRVNATGVFLITRAFGETMVEQGSGSIVNIGSMMGTVGPSPEFYEGTGMGTPAPDYFFHKAGMINLTRYFASVFGRRNVRVNCVSPGGLFNQQPKPFLERYERRTMLGRMAGQDDLGGAVVFLLSDAAGYVTGIDLPVDGGYTAK